MANATGEEKPDPSRLRLDRAVRLLFRGTAISSDGSLLVYRELNDALGLTDLASRAFSDQSDLSD